MPFKPTPIRIGLPSFRATLWVWVLAVATSASGQQIQSGVSGGAVNIPQTNLVPITPPPSGFAPPSSGLGRFDPYANNQTPDLGAGYGFGGSSGFGASPSSPGVIPAPTLNYNTAPPISGGGVTVIGPPDAGPFLPPSAGISPSPPGGSLLSRIFSRPASSPITPGFGTTLQGPLTNSPTIYGVPPQGAAVDSFGQPINGTFDNPNVYGPPTGYAAPPGSTYPSTAYPSSSPSTLFPEGLFQGGIFSGGAFNNPAESFSAFRLFQGLRLRHGYVSGGNDPDHLAMNDTDSSLVFAFPNFLYTAQPIYVIPSFSLHLWDGPDGSTGADLPPNAYSAFLDVGWNSDPNQMLATEFGVRVGVFSDFKTYNSKSIRVLGKGLVSFRVTPASTLKAGVYYLDRNSIKLVPAGGILWQPNPWSRFDVFFPTPKFARYWRTLGTRDLWWYLAGDYGGGTWTIQRTDGTDDSIDINDYRAIFGLEWGTSDAIRMGRRTGFAEVGYVFEREVEYRFNPMDNIKPNDGIMVRVGIGY